MTTSPSTFYDFTVFYLESRCLVPTLPKACYLFTFLSSFCLSHTQFYWFTCSQNCFFQSPQHAQLTQPAVFIASCANSVSKRVLMWAVTAHQLHTFSHLKFTSAGPIQRASYFVFTPSRGKWAHNTSAPREHATSWHIYLPTAHLVFKFHYSHKSFAEHSLT